MKRVVSSCAMMAALALLLACGDSSDPESPNTTPVDVTGQWGVQVTLTNSVMRCTIGELRLRFTQTGTMVSGVSEQTQSSVSCVGTNGNLPPGTTTPPSGIIGDLTGSNVGNRVSVTVDSFGDDELILDGTATSARITGTATFKEPARTLTGEFVAQRR